MELSGLFDIPPPAPLTLGGTTLHFLPYANYWRSSVGPVFGSVTVGLSMTAMSFAPACGEIAFGAALVLVILFAPNGSIEILKKAWAEL